MTSQKKLGPIDRAIVGAAIAPFKEPDPDRVIRRTMFVAAGHVILALGLLAFLPLLGPAIEERRARLAGLPHVVLKALRDDTTMWRNR